MKLTYKIGIAALAASLLTTTGCVNNLTDDVDASASVSAAYVARGTSFNVESISGDGSWEATDTDTNYSVSVNFDAPVDKDTVTSGIKVYKLYGTDGDSEYTESTQSYDAIYSNSDKTVTLSMNLNGVYGIRVAVIGANIKSTGGLNLDVDGDKVYGESGDDDYFEYLYSSDRTDTVLDGVEKVRLSGNQFGYFSFDFDNSRVVFTSYYTKARTGDLTATLANAKVQYFNTSTKKWTDLSTTWTFPTYLVYSSDYSVENTYTYYGSFTKVTSDYSVEYRVVTENVQNLKTVNTIYGYVRRYNLNNKNSFYVLRSSRADTADNAIADDSFSATSATYEAIGGSGNKVNTLTLTYYNSYSTYSTDSVYDNYDYHSTPYLNTADGDLIYNIDDYSTSTTYYSSSGSSYVVYTLNGFSGTAASAAKKLHFYNVNGEEVSASVTQSYTPSSNTLVVVFDNAISIPGSTLYVYAEPDFAVEYTRTTFTATALADDSPYKDGTYGYYSYKYTVATSTATFTVGNDTAVEDNITGTALRLIATVNLSE